MPPSPGLCSKTIWHTTPPLLKIKLDCDKTTFDETTEEEANF